MKGLILSGGKGTRLRPLTFTRAKQLIPIANKPNLFYVVEDLLAAGITDIGVIISPETGDEIVRALTSADYEDATFTFITQDEPLGLAHAVKTGREFLGDEPFVMYLGDNLLTGGIAGLVGQYEQGGCQSTILLARVENPSQFGVAEFDDQGRISRLVEKPSDPPSDLVLVGVYLFSPLIHEIIDGLQPSWRGEYEITDAIQGLIERGEVVVHQEVRGYWKDTGRPDDLLDANRLVLSQMTRRIEGEAINSSLIGEVVLEPGARVIDSEILGPAHIATGAVVQDAYVGPHTAIGAGVTVVHSEVEYSILLAESTVANLDRRLTASVIGKGSRIDGQARKRKNSVQLVLGDHSQVNL